MCMRMCMHVHARVYACMLTVCAAALAPQEVLAKQSKFSKLRESWSWGEGVCTPALAARAEVERTEATACCTCQALIMHMRRL